MFGLNKYIDKIYEIQWKFDIQQQKKFEELFYVKFQQNEKGNFQISEIDYSYVDILIGLEEINFIFTKYNNEYNIEIIKD